MSRSRHKTSAEAAAAFSELYNRRRAAARAKRAKEPPPLLEAPVVPASVMPRRDVQSPRVARPADIGPDTLFVLVPVPIATYYELIDHCRDFGFTPQTFIKQALAQAKLSRGGV